MTDSMQANDTNIQVILVKQVHFKSAIATIIIDVV